ncbi:MAG: alkaline phosphatase family protein [Dysgonamonadaceae bacterium]|jgi:hypothetical protein|nr:alkaline phosphatase family protein [Dysgonamonadaceae bacterium]
MKNLINIFTVSLLAAFCLIFYPSCTVYDTPGEIEDDGQTQAGISTKINRKVLWINLDGAVGSVVEQTMPQDGALSKMLKNSKYSWLGLSDNRVLPAEKNEDPVTWASLLTGVIPEKHNVTDDSYTANVEYNPSNPDEKVVQYPNIIHHITSNDANMLTLCVTPWRNLNEKMLNNAKTTITSENDAQAKDIVKENLLNSDYSFILLGFSGMMNAGKSGGFSKENANYVAALRTIDGYVAELLEAIEERENVFYEDWLIIITSNHGGTATGHFGGNSEPERNTFGLFYYSHYTEQLMKGRKLYGTFFNQRRFKAVAFDSIASLGLGAESNFSMELIMRMLPKNDGTYGGNNWDKIIGKSKWGLFRQRSTLSFRTESSPAFERATTGFNEAQWHHYGISLGNMMNGQREWMISLDGKLVEKGTTNAPGVLLDSSFLVIGDANVPTPFYVAEVRLWKKALTDPEFVQLADQLDIAPSDSRFNDLLAYWKFKPSELIGKLAADTLIIKNQVAGGFNMYYVKLNNDDTRPIEEIAFTELANTLPVYKRSGDLIMENTLVVPQILYWLGISTTTVLDGFQFIDNYALSEEWRDDPDSQ